MVKRPVVMKVGALASAVMAIALAAGAQPGPPQRGRGGLGPGGPGLRLLLPDDVTEAQRAQIRDLVQAERQGGEGFRALRDARRQLQEQLLSETPDEQQIATLREQIAAAEASALDREIALQRAIAQVLTPEQRAAVRERLKNPPSRSRPGERL